MEENDHALAATLRSNERCAVAERRPGSAGEFGIGLRQNLPRYGDVVRHRHAGEWTLAREGRQILRLLPAEAAAENAATAAQFHRDEVVVFAGKMGAGKAH